MKKSKTITTIGKRLLSSTLITALLLGGFVATDMYYGYSPNTAYAATLAGTDETVPAPTWNASNIPARDTSGTVSYWYAGNEFYALNQLNDGVQQGSSGTSGHLSFMDETSYNGKKAVTLHIPSSNSEYTDVLTYSQRTDIDFDKTWELMDTDAVWDDQYLFVQFIPVSSPAVSQTPDLSSHYNSILTAVDDWYYSGFSYDGSALSRPSVSASGRSWFSESEKKAVLVEDVSIFGNEQSLYVKGMSSGTWHFNAHLFAPSIDEMYYNPVQIVKITGNIRKDKSDVYNLDTMNAPREYTWSRSYLGVSNGRFFGYHATENNYGGAGYRFINCELAVAPAFYFNLEKAIMARSASIPAASAAADTGLAAYDADSLDTSEGIKFLIRDDNFASGFTSSINNKSGIATIGSTYSVDYSGASTSTVNDAGIGAALVISAALYDTDGKIVYYGPLSTVSAESGSVNLSIPGDIAEGNYTLALFEEQLGGVSSYDTSKNSKNGTTFTGTHTYSAYETDYQSGSVALMSLNVANDYHTGVDITNNNAPVLNRGDSIHASDVSAVFVSYNNTLNDTVDASDIYVVADSDWDGKESATNPKLVKSLTVPDNADGAVGYYIVVKDPSIANGYWASERQTVDCTENATGFDAEAWYAHADTATGVVWHYKLDGNGDIIGLYTKSNIEKIVDGGGTLNIPAKVAGRTVVKIGGGDEGTPVVPASEGAWTRLSLPATVTTINDFAFYQSTAQAQITIPSSVTAIGLKAFYQSEITGVKVSEMNGTIGSYAFGKTPRLGNVSLKGGENGLTVSTVAFADSSATDVAIRGNVTINKKAFQNNESLANINISGNVSLGESAFAGCSAVESLRFNGTTDIGPYAFDGLVSLERLYLPVGTTLHERSFNGNTALKSLESDVSLPAHSFENCGSVEMLVLDGNVNSVSYDWEGHSSSMAKRTIYVKNDTMFIEYYGKDGIYYSPFGSSGDVTVYVPATASVDMGDSVSASDKGTLTLNGYTSYAHSDNYGPYIKGTATQVTIRTVQNVDKQMEADGVGSLKEAEKDKAQTGIDAYYTGAILTTTDIDKGKMTVVKLYGSDEGEAYTAGEFYVVRTSEFAAEAAKAGGVTEQSIASYGPVHAADTDLDPGATTGTVSVTVVVFYDVEGSEGNVTARKYYSTPVSVRVEEYTPKGYIEQVYGSYDAIAERLAELDKRIAELEKQLAEAGVNSVEGLMNELNGYKVAYAELVASLEQFVSNNQSSNGYFGTTTDGKGNVSDVVFIEGNPTGYEPTDKADPEGNAIYKGSYDTNGDGSPEEIYFTVKDDGVHVVDPKGNAVTGPDGEEIVYKDELGALKRRAAAQLVEIKAKLTDCENGIAKIKEAIENAGYEIDDSEGADDKYAQIVDAINDMAGQLDSVNAGLENANKQISSYASALNTIYNKLTGSTLEADDISGIANILNAVVGKIQGLQNDLAVAKATVTDLRAQLSSAESQVSRLETELNSTKSELSQAESDLETAKSDKEALQAQYEAAIEAGDQKAAAALQEQINEKNAAISELETTKANLEQKEQDLRDAQDTVAQLQEQVASKDAEIADLQSRLDALTSTADGFKMTVDTANALFGLELADGTPDKDVYAAIQDYVRTKMDTDATISAIQALLNTTSSGERLVAEVSAAISAGPDMKGTYDEGYADGVASVDASSSYNNGYNAGYADGYKTGNSNPGGSSGDPALKAQIASLTGQVNALTSENGGLRSQATTLASENSALKAQVSDLQSQINELKKNSGSISSSGHVSSPGSASPAAGANTNSSSETTAENANQGSGTDASGSGTASTGGAASANKNSNGSSSKPADGEGDDIGGEGGTVTATTLGTGNGGPYRLGEAAPITMPSNVKAKAATQRATIHINEIPGILDIILKDGTYEIASDEKRSNALAIITYYMNNLEKLGNLGNADIKSAATDENKEVTADVIISIDITPSEAQLEAIENGGYANVDLTSSAIENGEYYFIVHESDNDQRAEGSYDVLLVKADGNELSFDLPDLSPVTIAKISISEKEMESIVEVEEEVDTEKEIPEEIVETEDNNGYRIGMYILLIVAVGGLVVVFVMIRKKKGSILPKGK